MSERLRIIIVFLLVAIYLFIDQRYFHEGKGIGIITVITSIIIAMIVYSCLVLFFRKRHKD